MLKNFRIWTIFHGDIRKEISDSDSAVSFTLKDIVKIDFPFKSYERS